MYDILILGAGPAGLTAALYAQRAGKTAAVIEQAAAGGQIVNAPVVENYPGLPHISGADFADTLLGQAEALGAELLYEEALRCEKTDKGFRVHTDAGCHESRALILALGARHRGLGLPGEAELTGLGVSYCAICDGAFYEGRKVAVVGGGDTALQDALFLSGMCRRVTVLVRRDRFRGEAARAAALQKKENVTVLFRHTVEGFLTGADGALRGLRLKNGETGVKAELAVDGVFLAVGQEPATALARDLVSADASGWLRADENGVTGVPGVFAAGDCRGKDFRQLATAVGDGAAAALSACRWLDRNG